MNVLLSSRSPTPVLSTLQAANLSPFIRYDTAVNLKQNTEILKLSVFSESGEARGDI